MIRHTDKNSLRHGFRRDHQVVLLYRLKADLRGLTGFELLLTLPLGETATRECHIIVLFGFEVLIINNCTNVNLLPGQSKTWIRSSLLGERGIKRYVKNCWTMPFCQPEITFCCLTRFPWRSRHRPDLRIGFGQVSSTGWCR